jgi:SWI/SNF-related matrix-associated actin-dependent regulator of chromatin subfamily B member 1
MDGTTILDEDLRLAFLPSLNSSIRPLDQVRNYTPQLNLFNESELEKTFDRGGPRKRRQPRGRRAGAVPLPDRDPIKTFRTPMIGFPEVEKEKDTWVAPSRRQAAMNAERANAQIAVIESEADIRQQPPYMGTMQPNLSHTPQASRQLSVPVSGAPQAKPMPEGPQKKTRAELLQGPPVAKRVRRSRIAPKSTALDPGAPIPEYLRGYDERNKGGEKKKNMYRERELPEGLHPNMVDGVWHCSSCGCPEDLAIGRRQGPLGPKTMCGECGKWWHRHRKPMDLVYRTDREYHVERTKKEEEYRKLKKKGGAKAAAAAAAAIVDGRAAALKQERQPPASSSSATSHPSGPQPLFTTVPRPLSHSSRSHPPPKPLVVQSPESSLSPPPFTPQTLKPPTETRLEVPARNPPKPDAVTPPPSSTMTNGVEGPPVVSLMNILRMSVT